MRLPRRLLARLVLLALFVGSVTTPSASAADPVPSPDCARSGVDDHCEGWTARYHDPEISETSSQSAQEIAASRDGGRVYMAISNVTGTGFDSSSRWTILAYDAHTGQHLWAAKWGPAGQYSIPTSIAVSPDGSSVYASGTTRTNFNDPDGHMTTIAFDASTGAIDWRSTFDGPAGGADNARQIAVSPDGNSLFVAGVSAGGPNNDLDYLMLEYDAHSGAERWATRWNGIGTGGVDTPFSMSLNKRGTMMYATGWSAGPGEFNVDYGTIAVSTKGPQEGTIVWTARYDGVGVHAPDQAYALALSPLGDKVFVTGLSDDVDGGPPFEVNYGYATVAYDAASGDQLWEARKQWDGTTFNSPNDIAVDPAGQRVVITGQSGIRELDFGTVTYSTTTGTELWSDRYGFTDHDFELAKTISMDPDGQTVYVSGFSSKSPPRVLNTPVVAQSGDQLTIAYDVSTGQRTWLARYNATGTDFDVPQDMVTSRDGSMLFTATNLDDNNWDGDGNERDVAVIAYDLGPPIDIPPIEATITTFTERSAAQGQYSDATTLEARLTDSSGAPISLAEVIFEFAGGPRLTTTTNDDGIAHVTTELAQPPGDRELTATFPGEADVYSPSTAELVFTIAREDTLLTLTMSGAKKDREFVARLTDADDTTYGLANREILFYSRDRLIGSAVTSDAGIATLTAPRKHGKHGGGATAVFEGDTFYSRASDES